MKRARPKLPCQSESALSRQVARFLDVALPAGAIFTHIASGGVRSPAAAGKLKAEGVRKGAPDFVIVTPIPFRTYCNQVIWIELKREHGGSLKPEQADWRDALKASGAPWFLCRTVDDVAAALVSCGVPLRTRVNCL